jgi:hypothetical protein
VSDTAPGDQWPNACALLTPDDVRAVFANMKIDPRRKTMGQIKHHSRVDRVEDLPKPIRRNYEARKTDLIDGRPQTVANSVSPVATIFSEPSRSGRCKASLFGRGQDLGVILALTSPSFAFLRSRAGGGSRPERTRPVP